MLPRHIIEINRCCRGAFSFHYQGENPEILTAFNIKAMITNALMKAVCSSEK
jgi:hypothetical protein